MTLTHPVIASMRDERDHTPRMSDDVPADGTFLVVDGSPADAEHVREEFTSCFCQDGSHRPEDRDDLARQRRVYPPTGAHRLKAYIYAVIVEETDSVSPSKDKKVHFLADDPSLPTVAESEARIAKDAEKARRHVARKLPGEGGKAETDAGKGLWGSLGIGKKR